MYVNQTQLGELFGGTSHDVGRWLDAIGLRSGGRPTRKAFEGGYVSPAGYGYVWQQEKTVAALEEAGHKRVPQKTTTRITGPFSMVESGLDAYQILNGDGTVSVWVMGDRNANIVTQLLNLAYKYGKLGDAS